MKTVSKETQYMLAFGNKWYEPHILTSACLLTVEPGNKWFVTTSDTVEFPRSLHTLFVFVFVFVIVKYYWA